MSGIPQRKNIGVSCELCVCVCVSVGVGLGVCVGMGVGELDCARAL